MRLTSYDQPRRVISPLQNFFNIFIQTNWWFQQKNAFKTIWTSFGGCLLMFVFLNKRLNCSPTTSSKPCRTANSQKGHQPVKAIIVSVEWIIIFYPRLDVFFLRLSGSDKMCRLYSSCSASGITYEDDGGLVIGAMYYKQRGNFIFQEQREKAVFRFDWCGSARLKKSKLASTFRDLVNKIGILWVYFCCLFNFTRLYLDTETL